jgi:hypothetical protein
MDSDHSSKDITKIDLSAKSQRGFLMTRSRPWVEQTDLQKLAPWLTMYDLPSEDPEEQVCQTSFMICSPNF